MADALIVKFEVGDVKYDYNCLIPSVPSTIDEEISGLPNSVKHVEQMRVLRNDKIMTHFMQCAQKLIRRLDEDKN